MKRYIDEAKSCTTLGRLRAIVLGGLAMSGLLLVPQLAFAANNCMQDNTTAAGGGTLNCNSNDVRIAHVTNITPLSGITGTGTPADPFKCIQNAGIHFTADFEVDLGAQARYDIGLYIAKNQTQALTGTCNADVITATNAPVTFKNLDAAPDSCGDITGSLGTAFNPQLVHLDITTTCTAGAGGKLALPNCTSWRQPGSNGSCTTIADAFPGSPSKCNCDNNFTIDVNVETGQLQVTKAAAPTTVDEPGGTVTYTVTVHNPAVALTETLAQLTEDDTNDGTVDKTYDANSSPTLASICVSTTLAPCGSDPNNCAAASTTTCSFMRTVSGNAGDTITDKACVNDSGGNGPFCATATVSIKDVKPSAAVTKTLDSLQCAAVRYQVKVDNNDTAESLTLTALVDDKVGGSGNITSVHNNVLGTTCGVSGAGLGTLSSQTGAGTLPATIATSSSYTCKFDAMTCTPGQQTDVVTATLNDNDSNTINPTGSATITVTATSP